MKFSGSQLMSALCRLPNAEAARKVIRLLSDVALPVNTAQELLTAASRAVSGDVIYLGPGTFNTGASNVQLPAGVHLIGSGPGATKIISPSVGVSTGHALLAPGTGSFIYGITVDASPGTNASPVAPIGTLSNDAAATDVLIYNCKILGNSDGFYLDKSGSDRWRIVDCVVSTTWDTIFVGASTGLFEYFNCTLISDGSVVTGGIAAAGVNASAGTTRLFGGRVTISSQSSPNGARGAGSGTTVECDNVRFDVSGTGTPLDLKQLTSSTVAQANCFRSDGAALATSGTITNLVPGGAGTGTVTNVATGAGLTGGPITTTGTIDLANVSATAHQWFDSVVGNVFHKSQPSVSDVTGAAASGANTDITSVLLNQTGLVVKGATSNALTIKPNETLTAGRTLNIILNDADRTITLSGGSFTQGATGAVSFSGSGSTTLTFAGISPTYTFPSGSATLASLGGAETFTGAKVLNDAKVLLAPVSSITVANGQGMHFPRYLQLDATHPMTIAADGWVTISG